MTAQRGYDGRLDFLDDFALLVRADTDPAKLRCNTFRTEGLCDSLCHVGAQGGGPGPGSPFPRWRKFGSQKDIQEAIRHSFCSFAKVAALETDPWSVPQDVCSLGLNGQENQAIAGTGRGPENSEDPVVGEPVRCHLRSREFIE